MNSKNIIFLLMMTYCSLPLYAMHTATPEARFLAGDLTQDEYIALIEGGLYGQDIAQKMIKIHRTNYTLNPRQTNIVVTGPNSVELVEPDIEYFNLYSYLRDMVLDRGHLRSQGHGVDQLPMLMKIQISNLYRRLMQFKQQNLLLEQEFYGG